MKDKQKRPPRRFVRFNRYILGLFIVLGSVFLLKRDAIQFRLHNLIDPIYGEVIFHSDPDGDGLPQLYHMTFNTALRYSHVEALTNLPEGASNGVYSPDGTRIAFQTGPSIAVMNADGSDIQVMTLTTDTDSYKDLPEMKPLWISPTEIVFQRAIGGSTDENLFTCYRYGPFLFDLETRHESPFFELPADADVGESGWIYFPRLGRTQYNLCGHLNSLSKTFLPRDPATFHAFYQRAAERGFFDEGLAIAGKAAALSPSGRRLARAEVYLYGPASGIEMYIDGLWQTIKPVHSDVVSWSPDERFLVYDGRHPDGTWVIALTSIDGTWAYPLIGNDGISYFAPNWRPSIR